MAHGASRLAVVDADEQTRSLLGGAVERRRLRGSGHDRAGGRAQLAQLAAAHGVEGVEMLLRRAERHGRPTDGEGPSG